jgi:hypothetical protein
LVSVNRSRRRANTFLPTASGSGLVRPGLELRSVSDSPDRALRTHSRARRSLKPIENAASATLHPSRSTRSTSSARLARQLRPFLCTFIRVPSCQPVRLKSFQIDESRPDGQLLSRNNVLANHS